MTSFNNITTFIETTQRTLVTKNKHFSTLLSNQLIWMSKKESSYSDFAGFRKYILGNIFIGYKMTADESRAILNAMYGNHRTADAGSFISFMNTEFPQFDIFGDDVLGSVSAVAKWLQSKNVRISDSKRLTGACLYCQLTYIGARAAPMGFGGENLITARKIQVGKQLRLERETQKRIAMEKRVKEELDQRKAIEAAELKKTEAIDKEENDIKAVLAAAAAEWAEEEW